MRVLAAVGEAKRVPDYDTERQGDPQIVKARWVPLYGLEPLGNSHLVASQIPESPLFLT